MAALQIVQTLDQTLQQENIRYCHWKSNEHVDAAVEGKKTASASKKQDNKRLNREFTASSYSFNS